MLVYHGTSLQAWQVIQTAGLLPRDAGTKSNWDHSIESNPDTVYLTDAYAMHFGLNALNPSKDVAMNKVVIIEMETDDLPGPLVPDEDALEQVSRYSEDGLPRHWNMVERTRFYRGKVHKYAEYGLDFYWSMEELGTGGHVGAIPASYFLRAAVIDIVEAHALVFAYLDTTPSVLAYKVMRGYLRAMAAAIFGTTIPEYEGSEFWKLPPIGAGIEIINLGGKAL